MISLKAQYSFLLLFVLVPLVIHLMKRRTQKTVAVSSLYLFYRKGKRLNRNLKLNRILLLLARLGLVAILAAWFMHWVVTSSLPYLSQWFPFEREITVVLDNRWDTRDTLISKWKDLQGGDENSELRFITLFDTPDPRSKLMRALDQKGTLKKGKTYLLSRFYGTGSDELRQIQERGIIPLATGPQSIKNTALLGVQVEPQHPLRGENIRISGWVASNEEKAVEVRLNLEGLSLEKTTVNLKARLPTWFEFQLKAPDTAQLEGQLSIPKDGLISDNSLALKFKILSSMRIAFVDDNGGSQSKTSKLYFIRQFFNGLKKSHPDTNFELQDFSSADWALKDAKDWNWAILGELKKPIWGQGAEQVLAFPQKRAKIQRFVDSKLGMRSYAFESAQKTLRLPRLKTMERPLMDKAWKCSRYLQVRVNDASPLIFSGKEVLFFEKGGAYFSAFNWSEYDFPAVYHAYFPVFLYRLFTSRWQPDVESPKFQNSLFERDPSLFKTTDEGPGAAWVDFSEPLLILAISLCLLEIFLILRIERFGKTI